MNPQHFRINNFPSRQSRPRISPNHRYKLIRFPDLPKKIFSHISPNAKPHSIPHHRSQFRIIHGNHPFPFVFAKTPAKTSASHQTAPLLIFLTPAWLLESANPPTFPSSPPHDSSAQDWAPSPAASPSIHT
jgi:hypothetical protein